MKWFYGVLLVLLAALFLQSGLLAYSMYVLLGVLLLGRFLAWNGLVSLVATRRCRLVGSTGSELPDDALQAEIHDQVNVRVTVKNMGWMLVPWVLLEDLLPTKAIDPRLGQLKLKGKRLRIRMLRGGGESVVKYSLICQQRGYFQIGPLVMESGDLFGLYRRYQVQADPRFLLVLPRLVELQGYDITSRRPIGEIRLTHRLYEDPTRIAGVRPYQIGDPLSRVHWKATARTGQLHCKINEPSTLAGATLVLDFHKAGYHQQGEPIRSELAVTTTASLINAVALMGEQVGLVTNGRDMADRIRTEGFHGQTITRQVARSRVAMHDQSDRLQPLILPTRRGMEQVQQARELLARVELTDGLTFAQLLLESTRRIPRDASVIVVLPDVPEESALALGNLKRQGYAITVVLIMIGEEGLERCHGRLMAEGIRDIRSLDSEVHLPSLCQQQLVIHSPYQVQI